MGCWQGSCIPMGGHAGSRRQGTDPAVIPGPSLSLDSQEQPMALEVALIQVDLLELHLPYSGEGNSLLSPW